MRNLLTTVVVLGLIAAVVSDGDEAEATTTEPKTNNGERSSTASRDKLIDDLFANYKSYSHPENLTLNFGITLLNVEFNEDRNLMHSNVWLKYIWNDHRLAWNAEETGVTVLRVPSKKMWTPDVTVYNGATQNMNCWDTNTLIYSTGMVLWVPPCELSTYCNLTLPHNPYGQQECMLKFGSWTFDGFTMDLQFYKKEMKTDIDHLQLTKYKVTKNEAVREVKYYDCCVEPYINLQFHLGFIRQPDNIGMCEKKN